MATHMCPVRPTEPSSHRPLKSRFDATSARVKDLKSLLRMWRGGTSAYRIQVRNELSKFNVWGDGFDATEGGLDARLRDSKELSKMVESTLDKFKDAVEGEIQQFDVTRKPKSWWQSFGNPKSWWQSFSNPKSWWPSFSNPRRPESKPGEFLKALKALNEGLLRLAPSIENPAQELLSRSLRHSAAMQSSTTPDNVSLCTNSTVLTPENDSTFSRPGANDNDVGFSAASMTSFSKSSSEVDSTDLVKANKFSDQSTSSDTPPHKSERGVSSPNYSLPSTVAPEATEADDSAEESLTAKLGRYALRCLQQGSLYLPRLTWNPAGVTDRALAGGHGADGMYLKIDVWTKTGYLWSALALVDSGSDVSLISKGTALLTGLGDDAVDVDPDKEVLRGVGGIAVPATHKLEAPWRELDGRNKWPTTFYVTELPEGVDVVLGQDWNKKSKYLKPDRTVLVANLTKRKETSEETANHMQQQEEQAQRKKMDKAKAAAARDADRKSQAATAQQHTASGARGFAA